MNIHIKIFYNYKNNIKMKKINFNVFHGYIDEYVDKLNEIELDKYSNHNNYIQTIYYSNILLL